MVLKLFTVYLRNAIKVTTGRVVLIIVAALLIEGAAFMQAFMMGALGAAESLPVMFYMAGVILTFITSVPNAKSMLFGFKDYDLVSSLPVSARTIVGTRLLVFICAETIYTAAILLPAFVAYGVFTDVGALFVPGAVLLILTSAVLPAVVGAFLGVLAAFVSTRFRGGKFLQYIALLALTVGAFALQIVLRSGFNGEMTGVVGGASDSIAAGFYPAKLFGEAAAGSFPALALFVGGSVAIAVLFSALTGKVFTSLNSALTAVRLNGKYKAKSSDWKNSGAFRALVTKELRMLFGSPIYLLNCTFGSVLLLVVSVIGAVTQVQTILTFVGIPPELGLTNADIAPFVPLGIALFPAMTSTTCASVSMEGKRLRLLASMPVSSAKIFMAKLTVNWIVTVPFVVIAAAVFTVRLELEPLAALLCLAVPLAYAFMISACGLVFNLLMPKLEWTTEQQAVKQSASAMTTVFLGMFAAGLPIGIAFAAGALTTSVAALLTAVVIGVVFTIIVFTWGKKRLIKIMT